MLELALSSRALCLHHPDLLDVLGRMLKTMWGDIRMTLLATPMLPES